jgi:thiol:disulfide interchange protein DsbD
MPRRILPFALLATAAFAVLSPAARAGVNPVSWAARINPSPTRPGEIVRVEVTATIEAPYHIYSSTPPSSAGPAPTEVTVEAAGLATDLDLLETEPKVEIDRNFDPNGLKVGIHEGTATFTRQLRVGAKASGSIPLAVKVRYMACNQRQCLPPKTVEVAVPALPIEAGTPRPEFTKAATASPSTGADSSGSVPGAILDASVAGTGSAGLPSFLLAAFVAGLLALVTPCVFPLIPVTFAYFTKEATAKGGSVLRLAVTYGVAIIVAFTAIGGILAATVGAAGANRLAANPWVNLAFAVLFVIFGVALLEVIELRLPSSLQQTASRGRSVGGVLGVFFMGLTFAIATFTCTAPFIGTVLVAASTASTAGAWLRPILGMATFAAAVALPFFLLALFPGLLARLPRSGSWLSTVKGTMGFLELAAALKFLSNTDLVWQWKVLTQPVMLALWAGIALAAGAWLLGLLRLGLGAPEPPATPVRRAWAGVFFAASAYFVYGLTGRPLNAWLVAFLPPTEYTYTAAGQPSLAAADELPFLDTLDAGLARAKAENKPVFIDFTGYACTNCRWMEKNIFPQPAVRAEMEKFVRVRLYTDGGKDGDENQAYQEKTFGDVALPLYAILTPDGKPVAKSAGITKEPETFAGFLKMGREPRVAVRTP